ncbi:hypothetical protein AB0J35_24055 [Nonomuraea angiospora]|uniref:hypothetical protein n=1 Tax=Nonomuraea angiospora TaxID=46172 RepID=UPI00342A2B53
MSQSVSHSLASLKRAVQGGSYTVHAPTRPTPLGDVLLPHARRRPRLERRLGLTGPIARPWHPNVTAIRDLCAKQAGEASSPGEAADRAAR